MADFPIADLDDLPLPILRTLVGTCESRVHEADRRGDQAGVREARGRQSDVRAALSRRGEYNEREAGD